ncbi:M28 family peptidase [Bittarella massiliensis (ex Durand et al. 2017)]|uniref:M28 family peptidase n=1 Tax=Bittarella massiliensis (ex Durand et al. 2017) TaxID=1720313 RepID=UPI001AA10027|nr:M28 family peptidase [Bittarella massiliensis (ex Durand et al. 2017)]
MRGRLSRERMEADLGALAPLVRLTGEPDFDRAARWIADQLAGWGIDCTLHSLPLYLSNPVSARVEVAAPGGPLQAAALPRSFSADCPQGRTAPVFYDTRAHARQGLLAEEEWYRGARGAIVLADNFYEDYVQKLIRYGAAGLIHAWTSDEEVLHNETVCPVWGTPQPDNCHTLPQNLPVAGVTKSDGIRLFAGLRPGLNPERRATLYTRVEWKLGQAVFPVAEIPGDGDSFVLVGNHLDSWHQGVTDNGTGNVLALELARVLAGMAPLKRGVKIAWWPGHSNGRYAGSTWYCDTHFEQLRQHCVGLMNIDSPGSKNALEVGLSEAGGAYPALAQVVRRHTGQQEVAFSKLSRGADLSFFGADLPVHLHFDYCQAPPDKGRWDCAGCGGGWWWHSDQDLWDKADFDLLCRDGEIALDTVLVLAQSRALPLDASFLLPLFEGAVEELSADCDPAFDLAPTRAALVELRRALTAAPPLNDRQAKRVYGRLNLLLYTACDPYHFDNTFAVGRLPGLRICQGIRREETPPEDFLFALTAFRRQQNRLVAQLNDLISYLEHLRR